MHTFVGIRLAQAMHSAITITCSEPSKYLPDGLKVILVNRINATGRAISAST